MKKEEISRNIQNEKETDDEIINKIFFEKYLCLEKLGKGSFGSIYKAECEGEYYAMKFEKKNNGNELLEKEASIINYLKGPNIPYIKLYGSTSEYNILIMQLLGKSLEYIFKSKKIFSIKTACMLGIQIINVLEYIHNRHIIHRDIKPDNFVMGINELSQYVYLIDFGLAKKYRSSKTLTQYPLINRNQLIGTARYASINALKGLEQSRRDDLEAVGYMLLYFIRGNLPWENLYAKTNEEKYKKILEKKLEISSEELCKGFPEEFIQYLEYTKNLDYYEQPNYEKLRGLFNHMIRGMNEKMDYYFDWTTQIEKMRRTLTSSNSDRRFTKNKFSNLDSNKKNTNYTSQIIIESEEMKFESKNSYEKNILFLNNLNSSRVTNKKNYDDKLFGRKNTEKYEKNKIQEINDESEDNKNVQENKNKDNKDNKDNKEKKEIIKRKKSYSEDTMCCTSACNIF